MTKKNLSQGLYLKEKRISAKMSQSEVAERLGYTSSQFISNWERGLCSPPMDVLQRLIKIYKVDPRRLVQLILEDNERALIAAFERHNIRLPGAK